MRIKTDKLYLTYDIPRLGKRIDVVLLFKGIVFCVEFKVGESKILEADIDQVLDYALDLKNFHKFSQDNLIVPILVATNYRNDEILLRYQVIYNVYCNRDALLLSINYYLQNANPKKCDDILRCLVANNISNGIDELLPCCDNEEIKKLAIEIKKENINNIIE